MNHHDEPISSLDQSLPEAPIGKLAVAHNRIQLRMQLSYNCMLFSETAERWGTVTAERTVSNGHCRFGIRNFTLMHLTVCSPNFVWEK